MSLEGATTARRVSEEALDLSVATVGQASSAKIKALFA